MQGVRKLGFNIAYAMSRTQKRHAMMALDVVLAPISLFLAFALIFNTPWPIEQARDHWILFPVVAAVAAIATASLGIPRVKLNAYETRAMLKTALFAAILVVVCGVASLAIQSPVTIATLILFGIILFLLAVASRYVMLHVLLWCYRQGQPRVPVLIYGAGDTGTQLAMALRKHETIRPVAFIDDSPSLQSVTIAGLSVYPSDRLEQIAELHDVRRVLLAMPALSAPKQAQIARRLHRKNLDVHTLPSFAQLIGEESIVNTLTPVVPAQFLNRNRLDRDLPDGCLAYAGRSIMVSGAGGSIGSELCRQILACRPRRLVLFEVSEVALYNVDKELRKWSEDSAVEIVPVLGSVTDSRISRSILKEFKVEIVFHAAAYKHVPLVESNPIAGLANNVLGTRTLGDAAHEAGVKSFILISTDKAVRPTNIMGASKRLAEIVVQDLARRSEGTVFSMVRFGNVLGSSGSVIPLFQEQIQSGGPVTVTHDDVTRYFMTMGEAARLVLLAGSYARGPGQGARGGDVFVLDMGEPVRIRQLARQMIEAAGYSVRDEENPDGDIEIAITGLRPGEKLHEELLIGEGLLTTPHPKILRAQETCLSELEVASALRSLREAVASGDADAARAVVNRWVEGYFPPLAAKGK